MNSHFNSYQITRNKYLYNIKRYLWKIFWKQISLKVLLFPFFSREGMKAKKRVTVLVFSVIMTFIGRWYYATSYREEQQAEKLFRTEFNNILRALVPEIIIFTSPDQNVQIPGHNFKLFTHFVMSLTVVSKSFPSFFFF